MFELLWNKLMHDELSGNFDFWKGKNYLGNGKVGKIIEGLSNRKTTEIPDNELIMTEKNFVVLYTSQKTKKAKTWHDGTLRFSGSGTKGILYDDKKVRIDTIHARPEDVAIGEQLESDRHYILIEEESVVGSSNQNEAPQSPAVAIPIKSAEASKPQIRTGLKRRRGGFVPPRMIAPRDLKPLTQEAAKDSQFENGDFPVLQESFQHVASFQQRYNIFSQLNLNRSTPESVNSGSLVKDPLPTVCPIITKDCNALSPVIGQTNDKGMATSPWSTYGASQSPANSKFKSWQDASSLETKNMESNSIPASTLNHTLFGKILDRPVTSQRKRSSSQVLALLSKTTDKSPSLDISSCESKLAVPSPSIQASQPKTKGTSVGFTEEFSEITPMEKGRERLSSKWTMLQSNSSCNEMDVNQSNGSIADHQISFRADSKNQPNDSHYDLISTPIQENFHGSESGSEKTECVEGKITHNVMNQTTECEMSDSEYCKLNEPQYNSVSQSQLNKKNELQNEMNITEMTKPDGQRDEVQNDALPGIVQEKSELSQSELGCDKLSQEEGSTVNCLEEEEEEEACLGGASFTISFSPLSVIPSDSDSEREGPQTCDDDNLRLGDCEDTGRSNNSTPSAAGHLCEGSHEPIQNDVRTKSSDENERLSYLSKKDDSSENEYSFLKNKLVCQGELQTVKKTELNTVTLYKDIDDAKEVDGEDVMGNSSHDYKLTELLKRSEIDQNGRETVNMDRAGKNEVELETVDKKHKDSGEFSQKSLGCLEFSPDSMRNFPSSSPSVSVSREQTLYKKVNHLSGVNPGNHKLPVFETSWSDDSSLFDTSPLRQGTHPQPVNQLDTNSPVFPKSSNEFQGTSPRGSEISSVECRDIMGKLGSNRDRFQNSALFTTRCESDLKGYSGKTLEMETACDTDSQAATAGGFTDEYSSTPPGVMESRYREGPSTHRQCVSSLSDLPHPSALTGSPQNTKQKNLSQKIYEKMEAYKMRGSVTGMVARRRRGLESQWTGTCESSAPSLGYSQARRIPQRGALKVDAQDQCSSGDWIDNLHRENRNCDGGGVRHQQREQAYCPVEVLLKTEDQILSQMCTSNDGTALSTLEVSHSQDDEFCKDSAYGQPRKMCFSSHNETVVASEMGRDKIVIRNWPLEDRSHLSDTHLSEDSVTVKGLEKYYEVTTEPKDVSIENAEENPSDLSDAVSAVSKWGQFLPMEDEEDQEAFDGSYDLNSPFKNSYLRAQRHSGDTMSDCTRVEYQQTNKTFPRNRAGRNEEANTDPVSMETNGVNNSNKLRYSPANTTHSTSGIDGNGEDIDIKMLIDKKQIVKNSQITRDRSSFKFQINSNVTNKNKMLPKSNSCESSNQCIGMSPSVICLGSSPSLYNSPDLKSPGSQPYSSGLPGSKIHTPVSQTVPEQNDSWVTSIGSSPMCQIVPDVQMDSPVESVLLNSLEKKFNTPVINPTSSPNILMVTKRSLWDDLMFPPLSEVESNVTPVRKIIIPTMFSCPQQYKQVLMSALREHLNIVLFVLSKQYHQALSKTDTASLTFPVKNTQNSEGKNTGPPLPPCQCGTTSKLVQVRKEGPNKGRFFYSCPQPANQRCKFFQWAESNGNVGLHATAGSKVRLTDAASVTGHLRQHHVMFYCQCQFIQKSMESILGHFKNPWAKQKYMRECKMQRKYFIKLSRRDSSTLFSKDDLWIVSRDLGFDSTCTFLAKSTYYGPTSGNEVEIEPISKFSPSNWSNEAPCHAILAGNVSSELSYLDNIQENLQPSSVPILSQLLHLDDADACKTNRGFLPPRLKSGKSTSHIHVPVHAMDELIKEFISIYSLNLDQGMALRRLGAMFCEKSHLDLSSILLIHGVFGAGKSFLLSVMIQFLVRVFDLNGSYTPGLPYPWKILISSTTNVAVDRVLMGLLEIGFEDFVRVGSMKKIAKPVLPYSVHATGTENQELKDLQEMLRSGDLSQSEKHNVRQSIEKHKLGENKKRLGSVPVVGVTCASCVAPSLKDLKFPLVIIDECSQMTEPASLSPVCKFACEKLVLVGDPKQLDPTIQGSEASHSDGLEQTMFDRLIKMGHIPTVLRTQYRCHPVISHLANTLFYQGQLIDGVTEEDRKPVLDILPTLCFYEVSDGQERSDSSGSFSNEKEADFVAFMIEFLVNAGVDSSSIGVITLYKSQMYNILARLGTSRNCSQKDTKSILVSTVDAFQGGEREIIILSCVRTNNTGFIDNHKRTNVALTRARRHLFIVGHLHILEKNQLWGKVIALCKARSDGVQNSEEARHSVGSFLDRSSQESCPSTGSRTPKAGRKRKRHEEGEREEASPPMSLSGSTGASVDESPVILSSSEKTPVKRSRRRYELPQIDVTPPNNGKVNDEQDSDEELPVFKV